MNLLKNVSAEKSVETSQINVDAASTSKHTTEIRPLPTGLGSLQASRGNRTTSRLVYQNRKSLPEPLRQKFETLSGTSLEDVRVHYRSLKPAKINALAYTQGRDIYLGPGQEKHLPHEVWHVVQQKQGRVKPTLSFRNVMINDDPKLEREADQMSQQVNKT